MINVSYQELLETKRRSRATNEYRICPACESTFKVRGINTRGSRRKYCYDPKCETNRERAKRRRETERKRLRKEAEARKDRPQSEHQDLQAATSKGDKLSCTMIGDNDQSINMGK